MSEDVYKRQIHHVLAMRTAFRLSQDIEVYEKPIRERRMVKKSGWWPCGEGEQRVDSVTKLSHLAPVDDKHPDRAVK